MDTLLAKSHAVAALGGAAILCVIAIGGYNVASALSGPARNPASSSDLADQSSAAPGREPSLRVARAFLASWQSAADDYQQAADSTNAPASARQGLNEYGASLHLSAISFGQVTFGGASHDNPGASVINFTVTARVAGGTWTYPSTLDVIQSTAGFASVEWSRTILYFGLTPGDRLVSGALPADGSSSRPRGVAVLDSDGNEVSVLTTFK